LAESPSPEQGTVGPTRASVLAGCFVVGGVLGYLLVPLAEELSGTAPRVEWTSSVVLAFIAVVVFALAYSTHRTIHRERRRMDPRRAVNLLLLAKAASLAGAVFAGGYLGFALHFVDSMDVELPRERVIRAVSAAVASGALVISGLLLERACRVPRGEDT
jgi:Protein of unknown function (DUF3180)